MAAQRQDSVEALLENAQPRPAPPKDLEQEVRAAVGSEWRQLSHRRRRRRITRNFAVAATVLLAMAASFTALRQTGVAPAEVAVIVQSHGVLQLQGDTSSGPGGVATVFTGQTLTTGRDAAAGLAWHGGGSLRIDQNTRVEFVSADAVYLHSGRVYFDAIGGASNGNFVIQSPHGDVRHLGTQYLAESNAASLIVTVREGKVAIDGVYHEGVAYAGQRIELTGSGRPSVTNTNGTGGDWDWVETVTPPISVDGMSAYDFLHWVARETGHRVTFGSVAAEQLARQTALKGSVNAQPRDELRLRMMTMDIDAKFDARTGTINVTE